MYRKIKLLQLVLGFPQFCFKEKQMKTIKKINRKFNKLTVMYYLGKFEDFRTADLSLKEAYVTKAQQKKSDASMFFVLSSLFMMGAMGIRFLIVA